MIRKAVSKKKRRYQQEGFDLDLSYINNHIIGMGFPSENVESVYRNQMKEVIRFLDTKHPNAYRVYNLCSERSYDVAKFHHRVGLYPFDDHNAPTLDLVYRFCNDAQEFMSKDPNNVLCVHCKAGKGRTGVMICSFLLYSGEWSSAEDVLNFYAAMRTYNKKGVTIPSQIRYVQYVEILLKNGFTKTLPPPVTLLMNDIEVHTIPNVKNPLEIIYTISVGKTQIFKSRDKPTKVQAKGKKSNLLSSPKKDKNATGDEVDKLVFKGPPVPICGDIKVAFWDGDNELFAFWFNTCFYPGLKLELNKSEIDKANKDKKKTFKPEFKISTTFAQVDNTVSPLLTLTKGAEASSTSTSNNNSAQTIDRPTKSRTKTNIVPLELSDPLLKQSQEQKILNKVAICTVTRKTANQISENLITLLLKLKKEHPINKISALPEWKEFLNSASELQRVVTASLSHEESLAFWVNVWNTFALHHSVLHSAPASLDEYLKMDTKYDIGGALYTLPQIEFCILRHAMPVPLFVPAQTLPTKFATTDPQYPNVLLKNEPRLNFTLHLGPISSPQPRAYHPDLIFEELEAATRAYLLTNVTQDKEKKVLLLPESLKWVSADFHRKQEKLLYVLLEYLPEPSQRLVRGEGYTLQFKDYNWKVLKN